MTTEQIPLVSILIRSMDRPTLDRAIASAVNQSWQNLEIVVVAACGSAHRKLPEKMSGRDVRLIVPQPDRKLPRPDAANLALESARGEWLNFLDDDDELLPQHIETLIRSPRDNDERIVYSRAIVRDRDGKNTGFCGVDALRSRFRYDSPMTPNAMLFHRSLIDAGARCDPEFAIYEDHDLFVSLASRSAMRFVDEATCIWYAHDGESGCGHGANNGMGRRGELSEKMVRKWFKQFDAWDAEPGALLTTGQQLLKNGDILAAQDCLERALRRTPNDVNALNLCGMANLHAGNADRAESLLLTALRKLPTHTLLRENLALIRARRQRQPAN
ncbi:MAG: glycosyltransferase [Rudaea sp.]